MSEQPLHDDALEALRERIREARDAAQRVADQATAASATTSRGAPARGWATPAPDGGERPGDRELQALLAIADIVRGLVPEDLQRQIVELVKELLLLLRTLIDWSVDRLDRRRPSEPTDIQDIPIS
ncbi:MAG TPA: hypothetical protein VHE14_02865 [Solirubrobacteraceae bacterium]|nr:hypothetical protein [Solirubrobacteraceae bacterium]